MSNIILTLHEFTIDKLKKVDGKTLLEKAPVLFFAESAIFNCELVFMIICSCFCKLNFNLCLLVFPLY